MSGGEVVFDIAGGYNADMWDDTILIKNYERAYQASRSVFPYTLYNIHIISFILILYTLYIL